MNEYSVQDLQDNLEYLNETKRQIREAIVAKNTPVPSDTPFRDYAGKIALIQTGIDTSDATATANQILKSKTAYARGAKLTGTMPNNGTLNYTPNTSQQSIPAGYTSGGTVDIARIANSDEYSACLTLTNDILA